MKRPEDELASYDRAIALEPGYAEARYNRGNALKELNRPAEALASYDRAIALRPDHAEAHNNRGAALLDMYRFAETFASFDKAAALEPHFAMAHNNRAMALKTLDRYDEALIAYEKTYALKSDLIGVEGERLHGKMRLCDWSNFDFECAHLISSVKNGKASSAIRISHYSFIFRRAAPMRQTMDQE